MVVDSQLLTSVEPYWSSADGRAVLVHGDALEVLPELQPDSVECVWTDPPYLLSNGGISCSAGRRVIVDKGAWDKSNGFEEDMQFCESWVAECKRVMTPAGCIWVSGTLHIHPIVGVALMKSGLRILNDIIWEKPNPPPNLGCRMFTHSTELIYWATKATQDSPHKHTFNYGDMKLENGGKQMKTVWRYTAPGADEKRHGRHSTQKPVDLVRRCIRASTNADDLVLDPFVGSGSTGVAAIAEGRRFVGIDADVSFLEIASRRLAEVTPPPPVDLRRQWASRWYISVIYMRYIYEYRCVNNGRRRDASVRHRRGGRVRDGERGCNGRIVRPRRSGLATGRGAARDYRLDRQGEDEQRLGRARS